MTGERPERALLWLCCGLTVLSCATRQRIPIDCVPEDVTVYLDGEALEEIPTELELDPKRPHTLYFKSDEIVPELVVFESSEVDGAARLSPEEVCVHPRTARARRVLRVEIDPGATTAGGGGDDGAVAVDVEPRPDFVPFSP